ncbi:hypothetical protein AB0323_21405 [Arthrobacter sp. NPDC080031]
MSHQRRNGRQGTRGGRIEGLEVAAKVLRDADAALSASLNVTA